ncbi:MAG: DUF3306 domain-containing protein [Betaproteobacteria bacterium]|nr:DUF3306 domain-containing protein [Betaproteobacteria bacterium]
MADDFEQIGNFLSRWSRRKLESNPSAAQAALQPVAEGAAQAAPLPDSDPAPAQELPPVDSLTPESDFTAFMQPQVESGVKRAALKQLFKDPHFNVMDGLDTYIDDYSVADPIPDAMMKTLYQAREHLFSDEEKAAADAADKAADASNATDAIVLARDSAAADPVSADTAASERKDA